MPGFSLQPWTAPKGNWSYRPQTVNFGNSLTTNPITNPVVDPTRPVRPIVDPTRDPVIDGGGGGGGGGGSSFVDGHLRPSVVDSIVNPLSRGPNVAPTIHVAPSPLAGPNEFNPNADGSLSSLITGVLTGKTGIGPDGVPVHVAGPQPINPLQKAGLNQALTGILAPTKHADIKTGIGPGGELVHKAPSPKQGTKPGKQSLSSTVFASNNMPASAKGLNVKHVNPDKLFANNVTKATGPKGKTTDKVFSNTVTAPKPKSVDKGKAKKKGKK